MAAGKHQVTDVRWAVELDLAAGRLAATFESDLPAGSVNDERVSLLLNPGLEVTAIEYELGGRGDFASQRLAMPEFAPVLQVVLPCDPLRHGGKLHVHYSGHLEDRSGSMRYVKDQVSPEFTLLRWDSSCYPLFAEPSLESIRRAVLSTRSRYRITVAHSSGLKAIAPGELLASHNETGRRVCTYRSNTPSPSMVCAVGPYERLSEGNLSFWTLADRPHAAAERVFAQYARCARMYRELLGGPLHPMPLMLIELPEGYGSSYMPDAIMLDRNDLSNHDDNKWLYHELAHGWSPLRGPKWVHEGYTEFLAIEAVKLLHGSPRADARWAQAREGYDRIRRRDPSQAGIGDGDQSAYTGGALFMAELCAELGHNTLARVMHAWQETDSVETGEEFLRTAESLGGHDLHNLRERWQ